MNLKIAIVDDELKWREKVTKLVEKYVSAKAKIDVYNSGEDFLEGKNKYDIVLMDIEMPGIDGFDTLTNYNKLYSGSIIIILTTHTDFARKGYLVEAFRYIDKLNIDIELKEAFDRIIEMRKKEKYYLIGENKDSTRRISINDIMYIETEGRHTVIQTIDGEYKTNLLYKESDLLPLLLPYLKTKFPLSVSYYNLRNTDTYTSTKGR